MGALTRAYAHRLGEDEKWAVVGLLQDFDSVMTKEALAHLIGGGKIPGNAGLADRDRLGSSVAWRLFWYGKRRDTRLEDSLHACDDTTGFAVAVALVRPDKDLGAVKVSSLRKKWKDRAFAGGVDRDQVEHAAADLGVSLDEHFAVVLEAMQGIAGELGLAGLAAEA